MCFHLGALGTSTGAHAPRGVCAHIWDLQQPQVGTHSPRGGGHSCPQPAPAAHQHRRCVKAKGEPCSRSASPPNEAAHEGGAFISVPPVPPGRLCSHLPASLPASGMRCQQLAPAGI